jgi:hypothetical protein
LPSPRARRETPFSILAENIPPMQNLGALRSPKRNCSGEYHVITLLLQRTLGYIVSFGLSFCAACLHKIIPNSNKITEQILAEQSGTFRDQGSSRVERLDSPSGRTIDRLARRPVRTQAGPKSFASFAVGPGFPESLRGNVQTLPPFSCASRPQKSSRGNPIRSFAPHRLMAAFETAFPTIGCFTAARNCPT